MQSAAGIPAALFHFKPSLVNIGIVSDIHSNVAALEQAFALAPQVDQWICLGDIINQFSFSNDVVALVKSRCTYTILGNHEQVFFSPEGHRARSSSRIDPNLMKWLAEQPHELRLTLGGRQMHLVHSTPWPPGGDYVYPHSPDFPRFGRSSDADAILYGHTHQPVVQEVGSTMVINPGSIGEGRPTDNGYIFSFAVLTLPNLDCRIIEFGF